MKYVLIAYIPTAVIVNKSDPDGRNWVSRVGVKGSQFWVGTTQLYDTVGDCIDGNVQTIKNGIKQTEYEVTQKMRQLRDMKKLLIVD